MGQRMSGQKMFCLKQPDQGSQSGLRTNISLSQCMLLKPPPPILLSLAADSRKPLAESDLLEETQKNRKPDRLKPPIIKLRSQRMDCPTVRTTISLQPQCFVNPIKKTAYVAMTPQSRASASWTRRKAGPRIFLISLARLIIQVLDIEIAI